MAHMHELDNQGTLFSVESLPANERGLTQAEIDALSARVGAQAQLRVLPEAELTSTDKYIEEIGGGHRTNLMVDPPKMPHPIQHSASRRGGRSFPEKSGRDIGHEIDEMDKTPRIPISPEAKRVKEAAIGELIIRSASTAANGNARQEAALGMAQMQRRLK